MRSVQSLVTRSEKDRRRKARWRTRKAQLRVECAKDDPIRGEWRGRFAFTITFQSRITGEFHALDFYLSRKRVNSYSVLCDGKLWKKQISATDAMKRLRKALPRFRLRF